MYVHADHFTGTGLIKTKTSGVKSVILEVNKAKAGVLVNAGDTSYSGNQSLEVRSTPGHIRGCVTCVQGEGSGQLNSRMASTGDALLIHGYGQIDFQILTLACI